MDRNWVNSYKRINNSFKKRLLFRLGADAGFFSEFNNMVLAMAYCLDKEIRFELYSQSTLYSAKDAWNDFFIPFCPSSVSYFNNYVNFRPYQITYNRKYLFANKAYRLITGIDYLTQDIWPKFRENKESFSEQKFTLPNLEIHNKSLLQLTQHIIAGIWNYNEHSSKAIEDIKSELRLPFSYTSVHIRSGDKFIEKSLHSIHEYMVKVREVGLTDVFVLTDDYAIIENLRNLYSNFSFYTLCRPEERGYFHNDFMNLSGVHKYNSHLRLFASMDICASSTKFIGTFSSNPGMYMGMRIGQNKCIGVDFNDWLIW